MPGQDNSERKNTIRTCDALKGINLFVNFLGGDWSQILLNMKQMPKKSLRLSETQSGYYFSSFVSSPGKSRS